MRLQALTSSHDRQGFDCGQPDLNDWLRRFARQHGDKGLSKTFVATREEQPTRIRGYYALSDISPAHGARRYQETGAVLSCLNDFSWRLSP